MFICIIVSVVCVKIKSKVEKSKLVVVISNFEIYSIEYLYKYKVVINNLVFISILLILKICVTIYKIEKSYLFIFLSTVLDDHDHFKTKILIIRLIKAYYIETAI